MRVRRLLGAGLAVGVGVPVAMAAPAEAATIVVSPGESIQAAIDQASPGDVIVVEAGVYRENLNIDKDNITLRGQSAVLKPPASPSPNNCSPQPGEPSEDGICIFAGVNQQGTIQIDNVRVSGFSVLNFPGSGIIALFANRVTIEGNHAVDNGEYGIAAFSSQRVTFRGNRAEGSEEAGLYLGDTIGPGNLISGNYASGNGLFGFFVRDAFGGTVNGNTAVDNCSGLMFLDTGSGGPGNNAGWRVTENVASHNNAVCEAGGEQSPPVSGVGILLYGAQSSNVEENTVQDHDSGGNPSLGNGGIVLADATQFGGAEAAANVVRFNTARRNIPYDIDASEATGVNMIKHNVCQRGNPPELCQR
jgi:parallel beta-helix repeat protein